MNETKRLIFDEIIVALTNAWSAYGLIYGVTTSIIINELDGRINHIGVAVDNLRKSIRK